MSIRFERSGPLMELTSYPQWAQDMVGECEATKQAVVNHELREVMCSREAGDAATANFLIGIWPVIERFPGYMAQSLLKTRYGRSEGDNLARRWLVRNIRVEQNHAEYWLHWAEGEGIARDQVFSGSAPIGTQSLARWCDDISGAGSLAASVAAVNYAIEGATGEWSHHVYENSDYTGRFPDETRKRTLRWLQLHAAYDDTHPWEALEIVCTLLGTAPSVDDVAHVTECVKRSYVSTCISMDSCLRGQYAVETEFEVEVEAEAIAAA